MKKQSTVSPGAAVTTDYIGGIQYSNGIIDFIQTSEGIARNNAGTYSYEYNLMDHLGNVRLSFNQHPVSGALQVLQKDDYYSFGLRKLAQAGPNQYLYNGKELQEELGQYDYGARFYDPIIGRFNVIDRFAEKYANMTPYQYGGNNPIKTIDVNGDSLMVITLKGMDSKNTQLKKREYYVDSEIGYQMQAFAEGAMEKFGNLSVNNVYRSFSSSEINTGNTKAKGLSRHQGGFAIDFNGIKTLSPSQLKTLNELAKTHGLAPLVNQASDPPHFDSDPTKYGYKSLKESVDENKAHYDNIKGGKAEPVKFDQKKYDEYKKKHENENKQ